MMQDPVGTVIVRVRTSDDANHREILTVRAGDCVEDTQPSDCERHDARADASSPSVTVGCVPCIELIAAADQVERWLSYEVVEQREVEVAGNGKHVADADLHQPPGNVAAERRLG